MTRRAVFLNALAKVIDTAQDLSETICGGSEDAESIGHEADEVRHALMGFSNLLEELEADPADWLRQSGRRMAQ